LEANEVITGLVDWDLAGPGQLIEHVAFVAWHFSPLHGELMAMVRHGRRQATAPADGARWPALTG
jgi:hypothetical protein